MMGSKKVGRMVQTGQRKKSEVRDLSSSHEYSTHTPESSSQGAQDVVSELVET